MSTRTRHLALLLICALALISPAAAQTESKPCKLEQLAQWIEHNASPQRIKQLTQDGKQSVQQALTEALNEAHHQRALRSGLFIYEPSDTTDPLPAWTRPNKQTQARCTTAVLLVHGLDEPGDIWDELAPKLHDEGFCVARFDYPNDQSIADSSAMLATALRQLAVIGVTDVNIVAHPMGGLVARDLLTAPAHFDGITADHPDLPNVPNLITVGTPNLGSAFAPLRSLGELRDQFQRLPSFKEIRAPDLLAFVADGNGDAGADLTPGSPYLENLNARPLPQGTHITVIAGRVAPGVSESIADLLDSSFARALLDEDQIAALSDYAASANDAVGDGVVTLDSALALDIQDEVVLDADHRSMLRTVPIERQIRRWMGDPRDEPPAIPIILDRLRPSLPDQSQ